jgi:hypothetical protein
MAMTRIYKPCPSNRSMATGSSLHSASIAVQSRPQVDGSVVLLALGLVTAIAVFLLTYRGALL